MRGTYRLRVAVEDLRIRWLGLKARSTVSRFPTVKVKSAHGLSAPLIVTLTSYPPRYPNLGKTLKSLLDQTVRADRTILWIDDQDIASLPEEVLALRSYGLEILPAANLRSYNKLIPALEKWPDANFVTADDDIYYPPSWLKNLTDVAQNYPNDVIAARMHLASIDTNGSFKKYCEWQLASDFKLAPTSDTRVFPTGVGGVLYPPGAFDATVFDKNLLTKLAPHADDIWFFWMARKAGTQQRRSDRWFDIVTWPGSQNIGLYSDNLLGDGNDRQMRAMTEHFGSVP